MAVKKKKRPNSGKSPVPGKKPWSRVEWVCVGIDTSYYSISMGGIAKTKDGKIRVGAVARRWNRQTDYFKRIEEAAKSHEIMQELFAAMKIEPNLDEVYIVHEEPAAMSHIQKGASGVIKQQIEIGGAMLGGILRWGWKNVWQIQAQKWQAPVAADLGITTHYSKWNPTKKEGKFRAKEWIEKFHPKWDGHWPDLISNSKLGLIPRPDSSKARGTQSDDRYEALAMAHFMRLELKKNG
jgi:hypothetical protein